MSKQNKRKKGDAMSRLLRASNHSKNRCRWRGLSNSKERRATESYVDSTLRVVKEPTRKCSSLSKEEGEKARRRYWEPKEFVSRRFIKNN